MNPACRVRELHPHDLEPVVAIDRAVAGRSRRGFYEKRLAAVRREPHAFVALGAEEDGALVGFAFAQILDGEFGGQHPVAMLDALAVAPTAQRRGVGQALLAELEPILRGRGVRELRSQAGWAERGLLRFLADSGFALAQRLVLERPTRPVSF
jgi:GNAT superfamily N-acetyltransferase